VSALIKHRDNKAKAKGIFITFEGTEGAGKSTLIRRLALLLNKHNFQVILTREPGGAKLSEKIRTIILNNEMDPWTELLLYEAARREHVVKIINPAIDNGCIILCDRFADSSLAYQAGARKLDWKTVKNLNKLATRGRNPDLTILMDIPPEKGLKRATAQNRFEKEGVLFQTKVRRGFLRSKREDPKRWLTVYSDKYSIEEKVTQVFKAITKRFGQTRLNKLSNKKEKTPQEN